MNNKFKNIHQAVRISKQEKILDGFIEPKKRGRPKSLNMKSVLIRLDETLNKKLTKEAKLMGAGKSVLVSLALKSYFSKQEKKYKLVEV